MILHFDCASSGKGNGWHWRSQVWAKVGHGPSLPCKNSIKWIVILTLFIGLAPRLQRPVPSNSLIWLHHWWMIFSGFSLSLFCCTQLMRYCQRKYSLRIMWQRLIPCRLDRVKMNGLNQNSWKISTTLCQYHLYFLKKWSISPCSCVRGWAHAYALTNPIFKFWLALFLSHSLSEIIFVFSQISMFFMYGMLINLYYMIGTSS